MYINNKIIISLIFILQRYDSGIDLRRNEQSIRNLTGQYVTDLFTNEAIQLINNHDNKVPMFLLVNQLAPHTANEMSKNY